MNPASEEGLKYIAEGSYGCVFTSKVPCHGQMESLNKGNKKYVSKVSVESTDVSSEKEIALGKIITNEIANYDYYFAPILSSCPVDIGVISTEEIEKCDVVKRSNGEKKYVSSTLKYVGKNSILKHFDNVLERNLIKEILESHIHLTKALEKLLSLDDPIIHFDLKDENIIFNDTFHVPNIIDFGLSFTREQLTLAPLDIEVLDKIFYAYSEGYFAWNIEIVLICYISQEIVVEESVSTKQILDPYFENLSGVVDKFVKKCYVFENDDEKSLFAKNTKAFIAQFRDKPIHLIINALIENWKSWDNYSTAMVFFAFIKYLKSDPFLMKYRELLKRILLSTPGTLRLQPKETMDAIIELSRNFLLVERAFITGGNVDNRG